MIKQLIIVFLMVSASCFAQTSDKRGTIKVKKVEKEAEKIKIDSEEFIGDPIGDAPVVIAPLVIVEQMPSLPGGQPASVFIQKNLKYPAAEKKAKVQGTVYVSFIVEADGSISDVSILKGITGGPGCSKEALRLVRLMPKWIPGKQSGKAVAVQLNLPIKFRL